MWSCIMSGTNSPTCLPLGDGPRNLIMDDYDQSGHCLAISWQWMNYMSIVWFCHSFNMNTQNKNITPVWPNQLILYNYYPASIVTLAQRWPNINPYVGPTSAHQSWANMDLSIGPMLVQRWHANVGPTLCQHQPNVGALMLGQRWHNIMPMVVCQRCTNMGPTEAALLAFCEGNPSVTDGFPSQRARNAGVDVCLNNRLNKQSSWVTGDLRHQCDWRQCNIHMSKDVTVLFRRCTDWSKHMYKRIMTCRWLAPSHYLDQHWYILSIGPLETNFSENLIHIFAFKKMHLKMASEKMASILSGPQWVNMNHVFMFLYSRSVTMPGLAQNWSLLPAFGRFRRKVVLANYGVKKTTRAHVSGQHRTAVIDTTSLWYWVDVARRPRPNIGLTSVTILEYYNQNKQKCSRTKCHDSFLSSKKLNNNNRSLHDACKSLKQM